jgi:hypothetical protein
MTHKGVANSVSKFGGILFTPTSYTVEVCRTLEGQGFFVEPECPLHLLNPSNNHIS